MNKEKWLENSTNQQQMSILQKWSFLASNASLPWTVFIWLLISAWPINAIYQTIGDLQENYTNRTQKIIDEVTNTTYKCWEWFPWEYICSKITEIVERWNMQSNFYTWPNKKYNIEGFEELKKKVEGFLEKYPDNLNWELNITSWINNLVLNDPTSITKLTTEKDFQAVSIVNELRKSIPALWNSLKARWVQEYLSEKEKNKFLEDLKKLWYNWDFDIDKITNFFFDDRNYNENELTDLYYKLFNMYFWKSNISLTWEKIIQTYENNPLYNNLLLFILWLVATLLYSITILPFSWANKVTSSIANDYHKIVNWVNSKEEIEKINKDRTVLWYQSYSDAVKMFNMLWSFRNWQIIKIKWNNLHQIYKKDWEYYYINGLNKETIKKEKIINNLVLLAVLESLWININNIEIIDKD